MGKVYWINFNSSLFSQKDPSRSTKTAKYDNINKQFSYEYLKKWGKVERKNTDTNKSQRCSVSNRGGGGELSTYSSVTRTENYMQIVK